MSRASGPAFVCRQARSLRHIAEKDKRSLPSQYQTLDPYFFVRSLFAISQLQPFHLPTKPETPFESAVFLYDSRLTLSSRLRHPRRHPTQFCRHERSTRQSPPSSHPSIYDEVLQLLLRPRLQLGRSQHKQLAQILPLERPIVTRNSRRHALPRSRPSDRHPSHRTPHHLQTDRPEICAYFPRQSGH